MPVNRTETAQNARSILNDPNILSIDKGPFSGLWDTLKVKRKQADGSIAEFTESRKNAVRVGAKINPVKR